MTHPIPLGYKDIKNWNSLIAQLTDDAAIFFEVISEKIYWKVLGENKSAREKG